ncbi:replication factor A protein 1-like [Chenopodium quinoa]|uniref:replication factor A protein 1-like n=1 Tax=Chenopodium quinoa TaxID=63459 RepID=UPI000B76F41F|nr:replication factor A protein 1-like [Chenopodium quinoa]
MTFGGQTIIEPLDPTTGPVLPNYVSINSIPKTSFKNERFDLLAVVLYIEEVRKVPTSGGNMMDVREIIVTDQSTEQPLTISMWGGLAVIDTEKLAGWVLSPIVAAFTHLRPTTYKGFSLASSMSTTIISDPTGEEAHALRTWMKEKQEMLLDQATKILHIRTPSRTTAAKTIYEIEQKNAANTMQEERHWIQATIPDAQLENLLAYLGCNNCGKRCQETKDATFKCLHCKKKIVLPQSGYPIEVSDATGTLRLTAFAEDCEKLIGLPTSEIYEKKMAGDWPEFEDIASNLKVRTIKFQIAPTTSLTRMGVLKWAIKDVEI